MKILLILLVLVTGTVVVGALVAGPSLKTGFSFNSEPKGTEVRTEVVATGALVETVSAPGEIEPHTHVQISAEVSARILDLPFREGDEVTQHAILGRLDDKDLEALLLSANARRDGEKFRLQSDQAALEGLGSNLDFAQRELVRMQNLFESGDVSRRDLDNAMERAHDLHSSIESRTHSISVVESSLAAANAEIGRAEDGLANTIIKSPMDGVITQLNVEVGEVVTGSTTNPGTVLMTVADLSRMVLIAQVAESDIANVVVGQRAKIYINAYPDDVYSGTVRQIALQRSGSPDGTGFFRTEVEIDLQGRRIYSGLVANVDIEIKSHEGVIVPYQSIVVREIEALPDAVNDSPLIDNSKTKATVVYRMVDGKAVCTPVKAGASDLTHRIVLDGLTEDDEVIIGPYKVLETIAHDENVRLESKAGDQDNEVNDADASDDDEPNADETGDPADEVTTDTADTSAG